MALRLSKDGWGGSQRTIPKPSMVMYIDVILTPYGSGQIKLPPASANTFQELTFRLWNESRQAMDIRVEQGPPSSEGVTITLGNAADVEMIPGNSSIMCTIMWCRALLGNFVVEAELMIDDSTPFYLKISGVIQSEYEFRRGQHVLRQNEIMEEQKKRSEERTSTWKTSVVEYSNRPYRSAIPPQTPVTSNTFEELTELIQENNKQLKTKFFEREPIRRRPPPTQRRVTVRSSNEQTEFDGIDLNYRRKPMYSATRTITRAVTPTPMKQSNYGLWTGHEPPSPTSEAVVNASMNPNNEITQKQANILARWMNQIFLTAGLYDRPERGFELPRELRFNPSFSMQFFNAFRSTKSILRESQRLRNAASFVLRSETLQSAVAAIEMEISAGHLVLPTNDFFTESFQYNLIDLFVDAYDSSWLRLGISLLCGERVIPPEETSESSNYYHHSPLNVNQTNATASAATQAENLRWRTPLRQALHRAFFTYDPPLDTNGEIIYPISFADQNRMFRRNHSLGAMLLLIQILDIAYRSGALIRPCLFRTEGNIRSSREFLILWCNSAIQTGQAAAKRLLSNGLSLGVAQTDIDMEGTSGGVRDLFTDLRDGILFLRFLDCLSANSIISSYKDTNSRAGSIMKLPSTDHLARLENMRAFVTRGESADLLRLPADNQVRELLIEGLVEGDESVTLRSLWALRYVIEFRGLVDVRAILLETRKNARNRDYRKAVTDALDNDDCSLEEALLLWLRATSEPFLSHSVRSLAQGISEGVVLCAAIHAYHPSIFPDAFIARHLNGVNTNGSYRMNHSVDDQKRPMIYAQAIMRGFNISPMFPQEYCAGVVLSDTSAALEVGRLFVALTESRRWALAAKRIQEKFRSYMSTAPLSTRLARRKVCKSDPHKSPKYSYFMVSRTAPKSSIPVDRLQAEVFDVNYNRPISTPSHNQFSSGNSGLSHANSQYHARPGSVANERRTNFGFRNRPMSSFARRKAEEADLKLFKTPPSNDRTAPDSPGDPLRLSALAYEPEVIPSTRSSSQPPRGRLASAIPTTTRSSSVVRRERLPVRTTTRSQPPVRNSGNVNIASDGVEIFVPSPKVGESATMPSSPRLTRPTPTTSNKVMEKPWLKHRAQKSDNKSKPIGSSPLDNVVVEVALPRNRTTSLEPTERVLNFEDVPVGGASRKPAGGAIVDIDSMPVGGSRYEDRPISGVGARRSGGTLVGNDEIPVGGASRKPAGGAIVDIDSMPVGGSRYEDRPISGVGARRSGGTLVGNDEIPVGGASRKPAGGAIVDIDSMPVGGSRYEDRPISGVGARRSGGTLVGNDEIPVGGASRKPAGGAIVDIDSMPVGGSRYEDRPISGVASRQSSGGISMDFSNDRPISGVASRQSSGGISMDFSNDRPNSGSSQALNARSRTGILRRTGTTTRSGVPSRVSFAQSRFAHRQTLSRVPANNPATPQKTAAMLLAKTPPPLVFPSPDNGVVKAVNGSWTMTPMRKTLSSAWEVNQTVSPDAPVTPVSLSSGGLSLSTTIGFLNSHTMTPPLPSADFSEAVPGANLAIMSRIRGEKRRQQLIATSAAQRRNKLTQLRKEILTPPQITNSPSRLPLSLPAPESPIDSAMSRLAVCDVNPEVDSHSIRQSLISSRTSLPEKLLDSINIRDISAKLDFGSTPPRSIKTMETRASVQLSHSELMTEKSEVNRASIVANSLTSAISSLHHNRESPVEEIFDDEEFLTPLRPEPSNSIPLRMSHQRPVSDLSSLLSGIPQTTSESTSSSFHTSQKGANSRSAFGSTDFGSLLNAHDDELVVPSKPSQQNSTLTQIPASKSLKTSQKTRLSSDGDIASVSAMITRDLSSLTDSLRQSFDTPMLSSISLHRQEEDHDSVLFSSPLRSNINPSVPSTPITADQSSVFVNLEVLNSPQVPPKKADPPTPVRRMLSPVKRTTLSPNGRPKRSAATDPNTSSVFLSFDSFASIQELPTSTLPPPVAIRDLRGSTALNGLIAALDAVDSQERVAGVTKLVTPITNAAVPSSIQHIETRVLPPVAPLTSLPSSDTYLPVGSFAHSSEPRQQQKTSIDYDKRITLSQLQTSKKLPIISSVPHSLLTADIVERLRPIGVLSTRQCQILVRFAAHCAGVFVRKSTSNDVSNCRRKLASLSISASHSPSVQESIVSAFDVLATGFTAPTTSITSAFERLYLAATVSDDVSMAIFSYGLVSPTIGALDRCVPLTTHEKFAFAAFNVLNTLLRAVRVRRQLFDQLETAPDAILDSRTEHVDGIPPLLARLVSATIHKMQLFRDRVDLLHSGTKLVIALVNSDISLANATMSALRLSQNSDRLIGLVRLLNYRLKSSPQDAGLQSVIHQLTQLCTLVNTH